MTPKAKEILDILNSPLNLQSEETVAAVHRLSKTMNSICDTIKNMLYDDKELFQNIYIMNWVNKEKYRIVGNYIKAQPDHIAGSPERNEIVRFSAELITCEALAKIYECLKNTCGLSLRDFQLTWRILNDSGEIRAILFNSKVDPLLLQPAVRDALAAFQEEEKTQEHINQMLRTEYVINEDDGEED